MLRLACKVRLRTRSLGNQPGHALAVLALFAGMGAIALIDRLLPLPEPALAPALGQAVLLVCYEYYLTQLSEGQAEPEERARELATAEQVDGLLEHLDRELDSAEYFREPNLRPTMQRNLHNIFRRAHLTDQEVRSLRGVVARLAAWRGRRPG